MTQKVGLVVGGGVVCTLLLFGGACDTSEPRASQDGTPAVVEGEAPEPLAESDTESEEQLLRSGSPAARELGLDEVWTGDFDEMVQRRYIRVLVSYSNTHYFLDGAGRCWHKPSKR